MRTLTESHRGASQSMAMTEAGVAWSTIGTQTSTLGALLLRYGLIIVIGWIGAMKFTAYEAEGIQPLVTNSPLLSWAYAVWGVQGFSHLLGVVEITVSVLLALRPISTILAAVGSIMAIGMFTTTLSFILSTPGWEPSLGGFPALSAMPGQFLLKDIVLLGAAVWSLGDALQDR
jgi:reactive chlorine resistance protein C